jgi:FkbM family methyltransferase
MSAVPAMPLRARMLQQAFSRLPVPGRFLAGALRAADIDLSRLPSPILCRDRWNEFSVEISTATDIIERHILFQGYFEYKESRFIRRVLGRGQVFVDIGANIGWHSLLAATRVGQSGRVVAFEPASRAFDHLVRNIGLNQFSQVEALHYGLSNCEATFEIFPCEEANSGANSLYGTVAGAGSPIEQVLVRPGDQVMAELGISAIDFCKIDVEGAEVDVLEGLAETLGARRIRTIMIEVSHTSLARAGRSPEELIAKLTAHGFQLRDVRTGHSVNHASDLSGGLNVVGQLA